MTLLELQQRMELDVRRPLTADYRMQQTDEAGGSMHQNAASYIRPGKSLSSFERLEIYNRQYWLRVMSAVTEDYPALQALLGEDLFERMLLTYLRRHPSHSWTLRDLGLKLPHFLAEHAELCGANQQLAVDIAWLELAYIQAFDSAQRQPLSAEQIAQLGPDSRLSLQPHLQLLAVQYPVDDFVLAVHRQIPEKEIVSNAAVRQEDHQSAATLPVMAPEERYLAVHRYDDLVYYRPLEEAQFQLLVALRRGLPVADAIEAAFLSQSQSPPIQQYFAHAAELGWLCPFAPSTHILD